MLACKLIVCLLFMLCCIHGLLAACVCNEKGIDYCQGCQAAAIVRPKQRFLEPIEPSAAPVGDSCWCSKQLIEPAQLPKTCNKVRDMFQWWQSINNQLSRRMLEGAIEAKTNAAQRLAERLQRLEHLDCVRRARSMSTVPMPMPMPTSMTMQLPIAASMGRPAAGFTVGGYGMF